MYYIVCILYVICIIYVRVLYSMHIVYYMYYICMCKCGRSTALSSSRFASTKVQILTQLLVHKHKY